MDYRNLEIAIDKGDFELFCQALKDFPPGEFPELKLRPKIGLIPESEENADVYLGLLRQGISPEVALDYSKSHRNLESALESWRDSNK